MKPRIQFVNGWWLLWFKPSPEYLRQHPLRVGSLEVWMWTFPVLMEHRFFTWTEAVEGLRYHYEQKDLALLPSTTHSMLSLNEFVVPTSVAISIGKD